METDWCIMNNNEQINYKKIEELQFIILNIPNNIDSPYDFFKLIFTDDYMNMIVKNSNEYKEKKKKKYINTLSKLNPVYEKQSKEKINNKKKKM